MPTTYQRDDARRRINVELAGAVTVEDLLAIVDRQAAEQTWHYGLCYDARRIAKDAASTVDDVRRVLRHVVETSARHGARGSVAIVTDHPAEYAMMRMYSSLGAEQRLTAEVFRDPSDALRWLDTAKCPSRG